MHPWSSGDDHDSPVRSILDGLMTKVRTLGYDRPAASRVGSCECDAMPLPVECVVSQVTGAGLVLEGGCVWREPLVVRG
jgi:hypothetical protein